MVFRKNIVIPYEINNGVFGVVPNTVFVFDISDLHNPEIGTETPIRVSLELVLNANNSVLRTLGLSVGTFEVGDNRLTLTSLGIGEINAFLSTVQSEAEETLGFNVSTLNLVVDSSVDLDEAVDDLDNTEDLTADAVNIRLQKLFNKFGSVGRRAATGSSPSPGTDPSNPGQNPNPVPGSGFIDTDQILDGAVTTSKLAGDVIALINNATGGGSGPGGSGGGGFTHLADNADLNGFFDREGGELVGLRVTNGFSGRGMPAGVQGNSHFVLYTYSEEATGSGSGFVVQMMLHLGSGAVYRRIQTSTNTSIPNTITVPFETEVEGEEGVEGTGIPSGIAFPTDAGQGEFFLRQDIVQNRYLGKATQFDSYMSGAIDDGQRRVIEKTSAYNYALNGSASSYRLFSPTQTTSGPFSGTISLPTDNKNPGHAQLIFEDIPVNNRISNALVLGTSGLFRTPVYTTQQHHIFANHTFELSGLTGTPGDLNLMPTKLQAYPTDAPFAVTKIVDRAKHLFNGVCWVEGLIPNPGTTNTYSFTSYASLFAHYGAGLVQISSHEPYYTEIHAHIDETFTMPVLSGDAGVGNIITQHASATEEVPLKPYASLAFYANGRLYFWMGGAIYSGFGPASVSSQRSLTTNPITPSDTHDTNAYFAAGAISLICYDMDFTNPRRPTLTHNAEKSLYYINVTLGQDFNTIDHTIALDTNNSTSAVRNARYGSAMVRNFTPNVVLNGNTIYVVGKRRIFPFSFVYDGDGYVSNVRRENSFEERIENTQTDGYERYNAPKDTVEFIYPGSSGFNLPRIQEASLGNTVGTFRGGSTVTFHKMDGWNRYVQYAAGFYRREGDIWVRIDRPTNIREFVIHEIATQQEAEDAVDNTKIMTPLRTNQLINHKLSNDNRIPTETLTDIADISDSDFVRVAERQDHTVSVNVTGTMASKLNTGTQSYIGMNAVSDLSGSADVKVFDPNLEFFGVIVGGFFTSYENQLHAFVRVNSPAPHQLFLNNDNFLFQLVARNRNFASTSATIGRLIPGNIDHYRIDITPALYASLSAPGTQIDVRLLTRDGSLMLGGHATANFITKKAFMSTLTHYFQQGLGYLRSLLPEAITARRDFTVDFNDFIETQYLPINAESLSFFRNQPTHAVGTLGIVGLLSVHRNGDTTVQSLATTITYEGTVSAATFNRVITLRNDAFHSATDWVLQNSIGGLVDVNPADIDGRKILLSGQTGNRLNLVSRENLFNSATDSERTQIKSDLAIVDGGGGGGGTNTGGGSLAGNVTAINFGTTSTVPAELRIENSLYFYPSGT